MLLNVSAVDRDACPIDHLVQDGHIHVFQDYCTLRQAGHTRSI